ncbi:MAG: serine/threonine protein kinase [Phycisphaerales bacterium]|nr:serine/threonine protein kinase [Phycisphaerales bacterium]
MTIAAELFELPVDEREGAIRAMCADEAMATRVRAMMDADGLTDAFLDDPPILRSPELSLPRRHGLAPGTRVASYHLVRLVGSGSMGDVYEAESLAGNRVAVKIVRPGAVSRELRRRFEFETIALSRLHHPNIAGLIESGEFESQEGSRPYLVMEFVQGPTITEHVRATSMKGDVLLSLFAKVCDAVEHAHRCGVIHRDLKPANILVESATGEPKIVDFGVARELDPDATLATIPGHHLIGSVPYMSPEQASGAEVDTRSDVYSLGTVLYELVAGSPAFAATRTSLPELIKQARDSEPPELTGIEKFGRSGCDLTRVVACAMAKRAEDRYQSVGLLAVDLRRLIAGEPISIVPPNLWRLALASARRQKRRLAFSAIIAGMLAFAFFIAIMQGIKAHDFSHRTDQLVDELVRGSNSIVVELNDRLRREGHPLSARRAALESAQAYLVGVQSRSADEPRVIEQLAVTYFELGKVIGGTTTGNMGQTKEGIDLFMKAKSLYEQLLAKEDTDSRRIALARVLEQLSLANGAPEMMRRAAKELQVVVRRTKPGLARDIQRDERRMRMLSAVQMADELALRLTAEQCEADTRTDPLSPERWEDLGMSQRYLSELLAVTDREASLAMTENCGRSLRRAIELGGKNFNATRHLALNDLLLVRLQIGHRPAEDLLSRATVAIQMSHDTVSEDFCDNLRRDSHLQRIAYLARGGLFMAIAKNVPDQSMPPDQIASRVAELVRAEVRFLDENRPADLQAHAGESSNMETITDSLMRLDRVVRGERAFD